MLLFSESVSNETIDGSTGYGSTGSTADLDLKDPMAGKDGDGIGGVGKAIGGSSSLVDNLDQANAEIERLRKVSDKLSGELQGKGHVIETHYTYIFKYSRKYKSLALNVTKD